VDTVLASVWTLRGHSRQTLALVTLIVSIDLVQDCCDRLEQLALHGQDLTSHSITIANSFF
jgi:hypothetical protein